MAFPESLGGREGFLIPFYWHLVSVFWAAFSDFFVEPYRHVYSFFSQYVFLCVVICTLVSSAGDP